MNRDEKHAFVEALHQTFGEAAIVVVTRQSGMTVEEASDLRNKMRKEGARYKVAKNRLARLALKGTDFEELSDLFKGPTAIATSEDPVAAAKVAVEYAKGNGKLTVVGGGLGKTVLAVQDVEALAKLPPLDQLRATLIGVLQAPAAKIAAVLQAPGGQVARVLKARADQMEGEAASS